MANEKQAKFIIDVSAEKKRTRNSTVRFFSKDRQTAKLLIQAEKDKIAISKNLISRVEILLESVNASYIPDGKVIYNDSMTIESDGLFSYTLTDELLNYSGLMAFEIYIYYLSGEQSDSSNRIIYEQRVSAIDRNAGQVELVYIKDMEIAKQAVADKADEAMAVMAGYESSLYDYENQIKNGMDQLYDGVVRVSTEEITEIRAELPKVETAANDEITKIQAVLPDVHTVAIDETAKIKAQLPIVEAVTVAETEKIQAELPKVAAVTTDEITKIKSELPKVQSVATVEIGKIHSVLPTVEQTAQEVSDHADQKIAEYDAKFVSTDQKMAEMEQSQGELDAELKVTQQQIADADVYTKAETDVNTAMILDARNLSPAWSWSADGTDRFTKVYPSKNDFILKRITEGESANTILPIHEKSTNSSAAVVRVLASNTNDGGYSITTTTATDPYFRPVANIPATALGEIGDEMYISFRYSVKSGNYLRLRLINFDVLDATTYYSGTGSANIPFKLKEVPQVYIIFEPVSSQGNVYTVGDSFTLYDVKLSKGSAWPYTPNPADDYANAYPKYKGLRLAPSDNPADYDWSYTDEYVDYLKSSSVSKTEFNDLAARLAALENKEV